jgi:predicted RNA-binding Zn-ribbon protein involved in translation (DUF1610 family)
VSVDRPVPSRPTRASIVSTALEMAERDDCEGLCIACGQEVDGVEPDARNYPCDACGADRVFGAEEIILQFA